MKDSKLCVFFVIFGVNMRHFHSKETAKNSSEKHTGQHIFSLLTLLNVPIHKVRQKLGENMHEIFENWKILGLLSFSVFLVGAFSLKEKSPIITVGSFFFSLQSHSEWSTFYNLFICSVVHLLRLIF